MGPNFSYTYSCRDSIQVWHDDIHKDEVELISASINFINGFKSVTLDQVSFISIVNARKTYSYFYTAFKSLEELRTYPCASPIILNE